MTKDIIGIDIYNLAKYMHDEYERQAKKMNWKTRKECKVEFEDLPKENKNTMLAVAFKLLAWFNTNQEQMGFMASGVGKYKGILNPIAIKTGEDQAIKEILKLPRHTLEELQEKNIPSYYSKKNWEFVMVASIKEIPK